MVTIASEAALNRPPDEIRPLEYGRPGRGRKPDLTSGAVVLGVVAALFGAWMLVYGIGGVIWLAREWRHSVWNDVFMVAVFNLIGMVCEVAAFRWIGGEISGGGGPGGS